MLTDVYAPKMLSPTVDYFLVVVVADQRLFLLSDQEHPVEPQWDLKPQEDTNPGPLLHQPAVQVWRGWFAGEV